MATAIKIFLILALVAAILITLSGTYFGSKLTAQGGVFVSQNRGESWQRSNKLLPDSSISRMDVLKIKFNPRDPRIVYLGARENALFKSLDGGASWLKVEDKNRALSPRANVYNIAVDYTLPDYTRQIPERFYLGVYQDDFGRILKTVDGGISFKEVYVVSRPKFAVFAVEVDPARPNLVWVGTAEGVLIKSEDYGETWKLVKEFKGVISSILINPRDTSKIFVGTFRDGIFTSPDGGKTWVDQTKNLRPFRRATAIEVASRDPANPSVVYLGSWYGLLKSTDGGAKWQAVNVVFPADSLPVFDVRFATSSASIRDIYLAAGHQVYKSQDGGEFWSVRKLTSEKRTRSLDVDPQNISHVLVGLHKFER